MSDFNILALDGGGSRGVMEAVILQDLMNTTTMLRDHPNDLLNVIKLEGGSKSLFQKPGTRKAFAQLIDEVTNPIHPTEVFDMISGTSTGALIAFCLVGGKADPETGKRLPMTLPEISDFYFQLVPKIFQAFSGLKAYTNGLSKAVIGSQIDPFDSEDLHDFLKKTFGNATLLDFDQDKCIALATARRMENKQEVHMDSMEIFDTKSYASIKVTDVLMASTNVPIFFKTPWHIRGIPYVNGGLGANCNLALAIPRMKELRSNGTFQSALSVAPSRYYTKDDPNGLKFWMGYFPTRSLDGYHHYFEAKAQYPPGHFMRLWPKSKVFDEFSTDDLRLTEMQEGVAKEKLEDPRYLQDIIVSALAIAARLPNAQSMVQVAKIVIEWNVKTKNAEKGLYVAKAIAKIPTLEDQALKNEIIYCLALSYYGMNNFVQADQEFQKIDMNTVSTSSKFWTLKGKLSYHKGNFEDAKLLLNHAKSLASGQEANDILAIATDSIEDFVGLAEDLIKDKKIKDALERLNNLTIEDDKAMIAKVASLKGQCWLMKEDLKRSLKWHDKAIEYWNGALEREEDPEMIKAYFRAGIAYSRSFQVEKALELLEQAYGLALKMYKGLDLSKHSWFGSLSHAMNQARIDAKSGDKKMPRKRNFVSKAFSFAMSKVGKRIPGKITNSVIRSSRKSMRIA